MEHRKKIKRCDTAYIFLNQCRAHIMFIYLNMYHDRLDNISPPSKANQALPEFSHPNQSSVVDRGYRSLGTI